MKSSPILLLVVATFIHTAQAADDCMALRGDESILPGHILPEDGTAWHSRALPLRGDLDAALVELDSAEDLPVVHEADLNGDGHEELFLTTAGCKLCGSAGCPYVVFAPGSLKKIGAFFGHLAILDERINGYRIIQSYSRLESAYTNLDTYVFEGKRYRQVAHVILESCGLEQWYRRMRSDADSAAPPTAKSVN